MSSRIIFLLILLTPLSFLFGQEQGVYDVSFPEGMTSQTVYHVERDQQGFIWIATTNGVERYDGLSFHPYRLSGGRERSFSDGFMTNLVVDTHGHLWTSSERSVVTRYNAKLDAYRAVPDLSHQHRWGSVLCLCPVGESLLLGTSSGMATYSVVEDSLTDYRFEDKCISYISPFGDDELVLGTQSGLYLYSPSQNHSLTNFSTLQADIKCLYYDRKRELMWVGTRGQGLYFIDGQNPTSYYQVKGGQDVIINAIDQQADSLMLIGTDGLGLLTCPIPQRRSTGGFELPGLSLLASESPLAPCQLPNSVIDDILVDGDNLWLALDLGGLALLQPRHKSSLLTNPSAQVNSDRFALAASIDNQGRYWVAYSRCLACYDSVDAAPHLYMPKESGNLSFLTASDGTLWFGGYNAGLHHYDILRNQMTFYRSVADQSVLDCVYSIFEDSYCDIWVGGLNFPLTRMHSLGDNRYERTHVNIQQITDMAQLNADTLVVTTFDGFYLLDIHSGEFSSYMRNSAEWPYTNAIISVTVRGGNEIWLATMGAGLVCYDTHTGDLSRYGLEYMLPSLELRGVEQLDDSVLCVSTESSGIFAFDARHHQTLRSFRFPYTQGHGIYMRSSSASDGHGTLIFGRDDGAMVVTADDLYAPQDTFRIIVSGEHLMGDRFLLPSSDRYLEIKFTTNDLYHQADYRFEYRILGIHDDWRPIDDSRTLRYASMPPGTYRLEVRSFSASSLTSQLVFTIQAEQVLWLRWYFLLLYAVLLLWLISFLIKHYQIKHLSETDALTGILNRYGGQRRISNSLGGRYPGVFVLLDCDKFKAVNDTYGHLSGDELLKAVAQTLRRNFSDHVVMRLGGDEFAVYLYGHHSQAKLDALMQRFFHDIEAIRLPEAPSYIPSVSLGAVAYDGSESETFEHLYTLADERLYESKRHKGCWVTI